MTALSSTVLLIFGMVFLGIVTQETQAAGGGFSITSPRDYQLKQLSGTKCLAVMWRGVCANNTCVTKIKRTLSKKSLLSIASVSTETQPYHPFMLPNTSYHQQAVCYYDYGSQSSSCCDQIFSGLNSSAQSTNFGDWVWIKFKLTRYHVSHMQGSNIFTESKLFVLPWHDSCVMYKPCGSKGTCDNELKPRHYNCTCNSGWKGDNCTIEASTPMPITTPESQGNSITAVFPIIYVMLAFLSRFLME